MRKTGKLVVVALAAAALLALVVGEASARSFSVDEKNFELIWTEALTGKTKLSFTDSSRKQIRCKVTLLGSFLEHTIPKQRRKIATISHGTANECEAGNAVTPMGFPWEVSYQGFAGALPTINSIRVAFIGERWRIESGGINCEFTTDVAHPGVYIIENFGAGGAARNIRAEERTTIPLEPFICSFVSPGTFEGVGLILNLPTEGRIFITLI